MTNAIGNPNQPPAGWYNTTDGRQRWFDGSQWTGHFRPVPMPVPFAHQQPIHPGYQQPAQPIYQQPIQQSHVAGPMTAASLNVKREVSYVRQQKGHSILLHTFVIGLFCMWLNVLYISLSPNHFWHA